MKFTKCSHNPVLDVAPGVFDCGTVYEPAVLIKDGRYMMWYGGRDENDRDEICYADSNDGVNWKRSTSNPIITCHDEPSGWDYDKVTRPSVVIVNGIFHMWYSSIEKTITSELRERAAHGVEDCEGARLGHATSHDGIHWEKDMANPVMVPTEKWEKLSIQCPNVIHEDGLYRQWYCGGTRYEPDAVGYATSADGVHWSKYKGNPIFSGSGGWEGEKVGPFAVRKVGEWYYAFYNAYDETDKGDGCGYSRIGMARSKDGITDWERHPQNPLIDLGAPGEWDSLSAYKASPVLIDDCRWRVWYNASRKEDRRETIGFAESDTIW